MNLADAMAHVAACRAAGTLPQLDREIGFMTEEERDRKAQALWDSIDETIYQLDIDREYHNVPALLAGAQNLALELDTWKRIARPWPGAPDPIWDGVHWRDQPWA